VRVMLDRDLAEIYGVATRVFNQAVKRNRIRFPEDFMFQLTRAEAESIRLSRSQNVTLKRDANLPPPSSGRGRSLYVLSSVLCHPSSAIRSSIFLPSSCALHS